MNIKTADRLCTLRKQHNLSQEELAEKLGVSRQAVSKWERSEASPDTDNLIELAHIYGVTLDELLNGEEAVELIEESKTSQLDQTEDSFHWSDDGYDVEIKDDNISVAYNGKTNVYSRKAIEAKEKNARMIKGIVDASFVLVATITYVLLGFLLGDWSYYFLFILIPVVASLVEAISRKSVRAFAFPILVAAVYCGVCQPTGLWHPLWVIFLSIPVYYAIAKPIDDARRSNDYEAIDDALREYKESKEEK